MEASNKRKIDQVSPATGGPSPTAKKPVVMKTISSAPVKYTPVKDDIPEGPRYAYDSGGVTGYNPNPVGMGTSYQEALKALDTTKTAPQYVFPHNAPKRADQNGQYTPRFFRKAAVDAWEDATLAEWDENDHRIFVGDLGNECNDELLSRAFNKYPTFKKAKIIRDKRTSKTKGYGFVSFGDPADLVQAIKEVNGKYIGNRPCKIRKSNWKDRLDNERIDKDKNWQVKHKKAGQTVFHSPANLPAPPKYPGQPPQQQY
eukprot:TRINITY_DN4601_c0_g1_i1.p1 TRINITY_DN4601_c0_g1~~TRINITY_DN4601_c0_g1_i1.p1  ORF type:complete len:258 (-),score=62.85 TRINITY_DN4601_c0_g1_i1:96-869(-)